MWKLFPDIFIIILIIKFSDDIFYIYLKSIFKIKVDILASIDTITFLEEGIVRGYFNKVFAHNNKFFNFNVSVLNN